MVQLGHLRKTRIFPVSKHCQKHQIHVVLVAMETQTQKIEVSAELAKELIPIIEDQITDIENQIVSLEDERDHKAKQLAELKAKINGAVATASANGVKKRLRKGQGERLILEYLSGLSASEGMPIQEIVDATGVSYSSAFRILNENKNGHFDNPEGRWILKKKK